MAPLTGPAVLRQAKTLTLDPKPPVFPTPFKSLQEPSNTFAEVGRAWSISGTSVEGVAVAANLAIGERKPSQPCPPGNLRMATTEAAQKVNNPTPQLGQLDPQPRQPLFATISPAVLGQLQPDTDHDRDFWGRLREPFEQAGACQPSAQRRPIQAEVRWLDQRAKPPTEKKRR